MQIDQKAEQLAEQLVALTTRGKIFNIRANPEGRPQANHGRCQQGGPPIALLVALQREVTSGARGERLIGELSSAMLTKVGASRTLMALLVASLISLNHWPGLGTLPFHGFRASSL